MTTSFRHSATCTFLAIASCAMPVFAQNAAPNPAAPAPAFAAPAATGYGAPVQAPADRRAAHRTSEQALLGAPPEYSADGMKQGNTDDAQRAALLDEQRMTVTGPGQGAKAGLAKGQRKAPAAANGQANGQARVPGQPARPNAAEGLTPQGAAKAAYADPYDAGKHAVYRSPW